MSINYQEKAARERLRDSKEWQEIMTKVGNHPNTFMITVPPGWGRHFNLADPFQRLVAMVRQRCKYLPEPRRVTSQGWTLTVEAAEQLPLDAPQIPEK